jgi:hypothetical protein
MMHARWGLISGKTPDPFEKDRGPDFEFEGICRALIVPIER